MYLLENSDLSTSDAHHLTRELTGRAGNKLSSLLTGVSKMSTPVWAACFLLLVIMVGLGATQWWLSARDASVTEFRSNFERLLGLETRWNGELMSLQLGFASNYDNVTSSARDLEIGWSNLDDMATKSHWLSPLSPRIQEYQTALNRKIWFSEQIKASYAMLRNSVSVLPDAARALYRDPEVLSPGAATGARISDLIGEIISSTIAFSASPTTSSGDAVRRQLDNARLEGAALPAHTAGVLDRFLAQVNVVVRERQRSNQLMLALTAVPTLNASAAIESDLQSAEQSSLETQHRVRDISILSGILLAVAVIFSILALRQRFVRLRKANWILHQVNENAEQQLMQSAKLSSLGQMVAGISHELNTPLAYVKAVFELIKDRVTARPYLAYPLEPVPPEGLVQKEWRDELETLLNDGLHGLDEMATFVRSMKDFSRLDKASMESFSVVDALESALQIAGPKLKENISINRDFDPVPAMNGSSTQLRQVFLNLIINASDAMAPGGQHGILTLRTRHTASDMIQIEVIDNGHGIESENLDKIFEPFFTTKQVGEGTGMGLSISYRIIEDLGGTITVQSKEGRGTAFTMTLPRQDDKGIAVSFQ